VLANTILPGPRFPSTEQKATFFIKKLPNGKRLYIIDKSYERKVIGKK
jgi:hypothetical protein